MFSFLNRTTLVSTESYDIDTENQVISSFDIEVNEGVDTKYTEGPITINGTYIVDDGISKFENIIHQTSKTNGKTMNMYLSTNMILPLYGYLRDIELKMEVKDGKDLELDAKRYTKDTPGIDKDESSYKFTVSNGDIDLDFRTDIDNTTLVGYRNAICIDKDNNLTQMVILGDHCYKDLQHYNNSNSESTVSVIDFSNPQEVKKHVLANYKPNLSVLSKIKHYIVLPQFLEYNNSKIEFEYDTYGILKDYRNYDGLMKYEEYRSGDTLEDSQLDKIISIHPLFYDDFSINNIFDANYPLIAIEGFSVYPGYTTILYTRKVYRVNSKEDFDILKAELQEYIDKDESVLETVVDA